jgi:phage portal protein BeeE
LRLSCWARPTSAVKRPHIDDAGRGAALVTPYAQSAWVYCAVSILAQTVAQIPFRISRIGGGQAKKVRALRGSADPRHRQICRRALNEDILDSGAVVDLFNRPHPTMDRQLFWEMIVTWNSLRGEFFILPLDLADQPVDMTDRKPRVRRLLTLPPEMFWHVVQGFDLRAWRHTGAPLMSPIASEILVPGEVIHSRSPNPYLYWRGMSPLTVAMAPAQTDFAGEQYQKGLWLNNADTGVIVTTEQILADEQRRAIEQALRERKRKAGTADRPLFLFGGAKVEKPTLSMMDMQFLETRKFLRQEIFAILKVPQLLAGFTEDLNDGGAGGSLDAQKASFIESTVGSLCAHLESAVAPVVSSFDENYVGWFDIDSLPIMQAARRMRWDTATKMFGVGVPLNDINENLDLGLPSYKWGGKSFLPFSVQEVGADGELPSEENPAKENPTDEAADASKSNPFERMGRLLANLKHGAEQQRALDVVNLWKKHVASRKAMVNTVKSKVSKVLTSYRAKVLSKLEEVHLQKALPAQAKGLERLKQYCNHPVEWERKPGLLIFDFVSTQLQVHHEPAPERKPRQKSKSPAPDGHSIALAALVDLIFNAADFGESLNAELASPLKLVLQNAGDELLAEVGSTDPWKYPPQQVLEYLAGRKQKIKGVGDTVRAQLNTSLMEGVENGETQLQLAARVKEGFNQMTDSEAKRVAMTEVNLAYNTARDLAMKSVGIEYKSWLSSHGLHVRPAHAEAEEAYINNPIPVGDPFEVGGEQLRFPGDDSLGASLENIINCQCVQLAARKEEEDEKSITFTICGYGKMKFRACLKNGRGAAAGDFGRRQGGVEWTSPQRAAYSATTQPRPKDPPPGGLLAKRPPGGVAPQSEIPEGYSPSSRLASWPFSQQQHPADF